MANSSAPHISWSTTGSPYGVTQPLRAQVRAQSAAPGATYFESIVMTTRFVSEANGQQVGASKIARSIARLLV